MDPAGSEGAKTSLNRVAAAWLLRQPLLLVAVAIAAGVLLHDCLPVGVLAWAGASIGLALAAWMVRSPLAATPILLLAMVCLGIATGQRAHYAFATNHIGHYTTSEPVLAAVRAEIIDPLQRMDAGEFGRARPTRYATLAEVKAVRDVDGQFQRASGTVLVRLSGAVTDLHPGDEVEIFGRLERPAAASNPGQFEYASFYRGRRVLAGISAESERNVTLLNAGNRWPGWLGPVREMHHNLRKVTRDALLSGFDSTDKSEAQLLAALILGQHDPAMSEIRDQFRASGTSHFLAVSGLHVGIVGGSAYLVALLLGAWPRLATMVAAVVVVAYACIAVPSPPVLRASVVAVAVAAGVLSHRRGTGVQMLSAAAIVLLLTTPLDLYRAGFQLSFVTVLGLIVLATRLHRWLDRSPRAKDPSSLPRLVRGGRWIDQRLISAIAAAVVAWIVAMPLVALHFGQFNPWAVPASLVASPFVVASLLGGLLKLVICLFAPQHAPWLAEVVMWPVGGMHGVVAWFAKLPRANVPLPPPPVWLVVAFYLSLLSFRFRPSSASLGWATRAGSVALGVAVLTLPFLMGGAPARTNSSALRVTMLAVGAGQAVVIESSSGDVTIVDAGSSSLRDPLDRAIAPFLRQSGYVSIDRLLISHANFDHYNGADNLVERYGPRDVAVGSTFIDDAGRDPAGRFFLDRLRELQRPPRKVRIGDVIPLDRNATLTVLWPPPAEKLQGWDANDTSLVLRLDHPGGRLLFTGDIQQDAMAELLRQAETDPDLLRADLLVAPHHGSTESNTRAFIDAVSPSFILSSNSRSMSIKQERLAEMIGDAELLRTPETGAITIDFDADGFEVSQFLKEKPATLRVTE